MPSNLKYARTKAKIPRSPVKYAYEVITELLASVSTNSLLAVSRAMKLGLDIQLCDFWPRFFFWTIALRLKRSYNEMTFFLYFWSLSSSFSTADSSMSSWVTSWKLLLTWIEKKNKITKKNKRGREQSRIYISCWFWRYINVFWLIDLSKSDTLLWIGRVGPWKVFETVCYKMHMVRKVFLK